MSDFFDDWGQPLVILALLLFTVFGIWYCCANTVSCEITCRLNGRNFTPAHYEEWTSYECMSRRKDGTCKMQIPVTHRNFVPDRWSLHWNSLDGRDDHWDSTDSQTFAEAKDGLTALHTHLRWKTCH